MDTSEIEQLRKDMYARIDKQIAELYPEEKEITCWEDLRDERGVPPSTLTNKTLWRPYVAMSKMYDLMAHSQYNGANQDEWCDWEDPNTTKFRIIFHREKTEIDWTGIARSFLAFKTLKKAELFAEHHTDLIEIAKPLL